MGDQPTIQGRIGPADRRGFPTSAHSSLAARASGWLGRLIRPDRRIEPRVPVLGTAEVEGRLLLIDDISRGGLRLSGYRGLLVAQDRFGFRLVLERPALHLSGEAVVAWRQGHRIGAAFYGLDEADRLTLAAALAAHAARQPQPD